jgi:hypothetical protein
MLDPLSRLTAIPKLISFHQRIANVSLVEAMTGAF